MSMHAKPYKFAFLFLSLSLIANLSCAKNSRDYLDYAADQGQFHIFTNAIPKELTVTIRCLLHRKDGQSLRNDSYLYVYPKNGKFSSIAQKQSYEEESSPDADGNTTTYTRYHYERTGGKLYKEDTVECDFYFWINGVSQQNEEIIIAPRREGVSDLNLRCSY